MQNRQPALGFIFVTLVLDILGIGLLIPIVPKLIESFAGDISSASSTSAWLSASFALMNFVFAPILGSLSDKLGRRPVILASLLGSGLDYLLLAFAPNLGWFFLGRIISGITGASFSAATAYIADVSPPEKRAQNFGLIGAAFGLGFILGPLLGGLLSSYGLRVPFFVAAGLTLLNWLYGYFVLPESLKPQNRREFSWARANPIGSLLGLGRYPVVLGLVGSIFLANLAQNALQNTWVFYTGFRYNWNARDVGISLAVVGLTAAVVQGGLVRQIVPKLGERRSIVIGLAISAISFLLYGLASQGWMIYVILVFGSIGGIGGPATQGLISRSVAPNEQGALQGSLSSLMSVVNLIGPLIFNNLFAFFTRKDANPQIPGIAFYVSSGLLLGALAIAVAAFRNPAFNQSRRDANAAAIEADQPPVAH
jgi:MFS transporter, DHA1 family, tetracycline resistance protein